MQGLIGTFAEYVYQEINSVLKFTSHPQFIQVTGNSEISGQEFDT